MRKKSFVLLVFILLNAVTVFSQSNPLRNSLWGNNAPNGSIGPVFRLEFTEKSVIFIDLGLGSKYTGTYRVAGEEITFAWDDAIFARIYGTKARLIGSTLYFARGSYSRMPR